MLSNVLKHPTSKLCVYGAGGTHTGAGVPTAARASRESAREGEIIRNISLALLLSWLNYSAREKMSRLFYGVVLLVLFCHKRLLIAERGEAEPQVFFLMLAYDMISNIQQWDMFFEHANPLHYKFFVHFAEVDKGSKPNFHDANSPFYYSQVFNVSSIPRVLSSYMSVHQPMNALADAALAVSQHENDMFVFVSSDALPVKPFATIRKKLCSPHSTVSSMCIAPTAQWFKTTDEELSVVKAHQWIVLNKRDATQSVNMWKTKPTTNELIPNLVVQEGIADEEIWFTTSIYGLYNHSSNSYNMLNYPNNLEQGICRTYVHWDGYPLGTQFEVGERFGIPHHNFKKLPIKFIIALKESDNFLFARKFPYDHVPTVTHHSGDTLTLVAAFKTLKFYQDE